MVRKQAYSRFSFGLSITLLASVLVSLFAATDLRLAQAGGFDVDFEDGNGFNPIPIGQYASVDFDSSWHWWQKGLIPAEDACLFSNGGPYTLNGNIAATLVSSPGILTINAPGITGVSFAVSSGGTTTLQAYNAANTLVGTASVGPNANTGTLSRVTVRGLNITKVIVTNNSAITCGFAGGGLFDDLQIINDPLPLPKPGAVVLAPDMLVQLRLDYNLTAAISTPDQLSVVTFNLTVKNTGPGKANGFRLEFPIDPNLEILSAAFDSPKSWVTAVNSDKMLMELGSFESGGALTVKATIRVSIKQNAVAGTKISLKVKGFATWGGGPALQTSSNSVGFTLGNSSSGDASQGAIQFISANVTGGGVIIVGSIFIPNEHISAWINLPDGTVKGLGSGIALADQDGLVSLLYVMSGGTAGDYSLVLYGERSGVQGVAAFTLS